MGSMTQGFRYHVATLAAVFFALGIGIAVGTAFVGSRVVERQTGVITTLERRMETLQGDIKSREDADAVLSDMSRQVTGNAWKGYSLCLIRFDRANSTILVGELGILMANVTELRINTSAAGLYTTDASSPHLPADLAGEVMLTQKMFTIFPSLASVQQRPKMVVLDIDEVAQDDWTPERARVLTTLARELRKLGVAVVVTCEGDFNDVMADAMRNDELTSISHVTTEIGLTALRLIQKATPGFYGVGKYVKRHIPEFRLSDYL